MQLRFRLEFRHARLAHWASRPLGGLGPAPCRPREAGCRIPARGRWTLASRSLSRRIADSVTGGYWRGRGCALGVDSVPARRGGSRLWKPRDYRGGCEEEGRPGEEEGDGEGEGEGGGKGSWSVEALKAAPERAARDRLNVHRARRYQCRHVFTHAEVSAARLARAFDLSLRSIGAPKKNTSAWDRVPTNQEPVCKLRLLSRGDSWSLPGAQVARREKRGGPRASRKPLSKLYVVRDVQRQIPAATRARGSQHRQRERCPRDLDGRRQGGCVSSCRSGRSPDSSARLVPAQAGMCPGVLTLALAPRKRCS